MRRATLGQFTHRLRSPTKKGLARVLGQTQDWRGSRGKKNRGPAVQRAWAHQGKQTGVAASCLLHKGEKKLGNATRNP